MRRSLLSSLILAGGLCLAMAAQQPPTMPGNPNNPNNPNANNPNNPAARPDYPGTDVKEPAAKTDDKKFLKDAAIGGMAEVQLGQLAKEKGSSEGVKNFGQKMIDDHSKANDQLKAVAAKENINVPNSLDSHHQARIDKLSKLSGEEFDRAYLKDQLKDHEADVKEFQREAQNGADPAVKTFASSTLPTLQEHLKLVKDLDKCSGKGMASRSQQ
jgi:putative membrane protein